MGSINNSLKNVNERLIRPAIPASPYRRMDTGAIGSVIASYPLRVFGPRDPRVLDTVDFLMENCLVHGGFFHDMTHSGINPYLTLHLAQVLLRAGDPRYFGLMTAVAKLASPLDNGRNQYILLQVVDAWGTDSMYGLRQNGF